MWAVASTLQSTKEELVMTKSIHSSKNSPCAYYVRNSWNQCVFAGAGLYSVCYVNILTACSLSAYYFPLFVEFCCRTKSCLTALDCKISAGCCLSYIFFSTFVSLSTWIPSAIFKSQSYYMTYFTFHRRLRPLTTNSLNFPNARNVLVLCQHWENDRTPYPYAKSTLQLYSSSSLSIWSVFCFSGFSPSQILTPFCNFYSISFFHDHFL